MTRSWNVASICAGVLLALASPLLYAQTLAQFDLPSQSLAASLRAVGSQTSTNVLFDPPLVEGLHAPALKAELTTDEAFTQLLVGTGLTHRFLDDKTVTVVSTALATSVSKRRAAASQFGSPLRLAQVEAVRSDVPTPENLPPAPSETNQPENAATEVVVTGTRVARDGYQAPTPFTLVTEAQIEAAARENIADVVNTLPAVAGSLSPRNLQSFVGTGTAGINAINLRGLGSSRTLILFDGQRSVPSSSSGLVDINNFPQALISRIEVVTGGASAAYGSDALSGVVNFVLNRKFTGVKADFSSGMTTHGDDQSWRAALTGGLTFAGDRGHLLLSAELSDVEGIRGVPRDWNEQGWQVITNPAYTATNGQPERLVLPQVGLSQATLGGIIVNTDLRGTSFGPGGTPTQFNYGPLVSGSSMQGGAWSSTQVNDVQTLDPPLSRETIFARASFALSDNVEVFGQFSTSHSDVVSLCCRVFNVGNIAVSASNPFLPEAIATQASTLGISQFTLGTMHPDLPVLGSDNDRTVRRYVIGAEGRFSLLQTDWKWDGYYQKGISETTQRAPDNLIKANFAKAIDAVRHPTTGAIVCRSTLTNAGDGCVPYNLFGSGVNAQAAIDYLIGASFRDEEMTQDVAAATMSGEPFSSWAGPVSLALGVEHRREKISGEVDPIGGANGFFVGNYLATFGSYNVTEGFIETVVPLAKDLPFAAALDLNGAVRYTDYSTSGDVTTWKAGVTYEPVSGIKFRATRSRDIRAPNLLELFNAGGINQNTVSDPFNNNLLVSYQGFSTGNLALQPEEADTTGLGIVLQPRQLPGLSASLDYFNIEIDDAISTVTPQSIVDRCFAGAQNFCDAISRGDVNGANVITRINVQPFNFVQQVVRGFDMQIDYRIPIERLVGDRGGSLTANLIATRYLKNYSNNGVDTPVDQAGSNAAGVLFGNGSPDWIYRGTLAYTNGAYTASLTGRGVSSGVYDTSFIECTSGCPTSTIAHRTINDNHIAGALYLDAYVARRFASWSDSSGELYFNVVNLTDKDPAVVAAGPSGSAFTYPPVNPAFYDVLGRVFRVGVRFQM